MKKVIDIYINDEKLPVFIVEGGTAFKATQNPTGNCWMLTFEEVEHDPTPDVFDHKK